jgi:hypothetical protein
MVDRVYLWPAVLQVIPEDAIDSDVSPQLWRAQGVLWRDLTSDLTLGCAVEREPDMGVTVGFVNNLGNGADDTCMGFLEDWDVLICRDHRPLHVCDRVVVEGPVVSA